MLGNMLIYGLKRALRCASSGVFGTNDVFQLFVRQVEAGRMLHGDCAAVKSSLVGASESSFGSQQLREVMLIHSSPMCR